MQLGFDESWIKHIMLCISIVPYRVCINREFGNMIRPTRGILQGDPISPYLFLICVEGLLSILRQAQISGMIRGCRLSSQSPIIWHLYFDESLLFFQGSIHDCANIMNCLHVYQRASSQQINYLNLLFASTVMFLMISKTISNLCFAFQSWPCTINTWDYLLFSAKTRLRPCNSKFIGPWVSSKHGSVSASPLKVKKYCRSPLLKLFAYTFLASPFSQSLFAISWNPV